MTEKHYWRSTRFGVVGVVVAVLLSLVLAQGGEGAVVSWIAPQGGRWDDPSNWNTSSVPSGNDTVYLHLPSDSKNVSFNVTLNGASARVGALYLGVTGLFNQTFQNVRLFGPGSLIVGNLFCGSSIEAGAQVTVSKEFLAIGLGACLLDTNVSLTIAPSGVADVLHRMFLGSWVTIVNKGLFAIAGPGLYPIDINQDNFTNLFVNEGTLLVSSAGGFSFIAADVINQPSAAITIYSTVIVEGYLATSGHMRVEAALTVSGSFNQTGTNSSIDALSSITVKTFNLLGGTMNLLNPFGSSNVFVGNFIQEAGTLNVLTSWTIYGTLKQSSASVTNLRYSPQPFQTAGLRIYNLGNNHAPVICDLNGTFTLTYVNNDTSPLYSLPSFGNLVVALYCDTTSIDRINYNTVNVVQPAIGTITLNMTDNYIGFIPYYNLTLTVTSSSVTELGGSYSYWVSIADTAIAASNVNLFLELDELKGPASVYPNQVQTDYNGRANANVQYPMNADVSYNLFVFIMGCVNPDRYTCSVTSPAKYSGADSGSSSWFGDHWWVFVVAGSATAIGVGVVVGALTWLKRRQAGAVAINGGREHYTHLAPSEQYPAYMQQRYPVNQQQNYYK